MFSITFYNRPEKWKKTVSVTALQNFLDIKKYYSVGAKSMQCYLLHCVSTLARKAGPRTVMTTLAHRVNFELRQEKKMQTLELSKHLKGRLGPRVIAIFGLHPLGRLWMARCEKFSVSQIFGYLAIWLFDCAQKPCPSGVSLKRALKM